VGAELIGWETPVWRTSHPHNHVRESLTLRHSPDRGSRHPTMQTVTDPPDNSGDNGPKDHTHRSNFGNAPEIITLSVYILLRSTLWGRLRTNWKGRRRKLSWVIQGTILQRLRKNTKIFDHDRQSVTRSMFGCMWV
jgi:hypothetical protein